MTGLSVLGSVYESLKSASPTVINVSVQKLFDEIRGHQSLCTVKRRQAIGTTETVSKGGKSLEDNERVPVTNHH